MDWANPFSAARVSGDDVPYFFGDPSDQQKLLTLTRQHRWFGQIVGPHGSGKSTLARHLGRQANDEFETILQITVRSNWKVQHQIEHVRRSTNANGNSKRRLFVIDGAENLTWLHRSMLLNSFQRSQKKNKGAGTDDGMILTTHRAIKRIPVLFETSLHQQQLTALLSHLLAGSSNQKRFSAACGDVISTADGLKWHKDTWLSQLIKDHQGNGREILMALYDSFEAEQPAK